MHPKLRLPALVASVSALLPLATLQAQTVWNGSVSSDATVAGNWTGTAPAFTGTDFNTGTPVNIADAFTAANPATNRVVDVGALNWALNAGSSAARTISNFEFRSSGTNGITYANSIVNWAGNNQITGNYTLGNNTIAFGSALPVASGSQRIEAGDKLTITGNLNQTNARALSFFQAGTVEIQGNVNHASAQTFTINGTGTTIVGGNITTNNRNVTAGTLRLTGDMTNATNATNVNGATGALIIDGTHAAAVNVTAGRVGGDGSITGNLSLSSGARIIFVPGDTLDVVGTFALDSSFGVASLVNADGTALNWSGVLDGNYSIVSSSANFDSSTLSNFGVGNAANLGGGRLAYFDGASGLNLTVSTVPEPASFASLAGLGMLGVAALRRRRRS